MKKNKLLVFVISLLLSVVTACHDELDTVPLSTLAPENFFNDLEEAEIAVNGVYDKMANHYQQNFIYMSEHGSHLATIVLPNQKLNTYGWYTITNSAKLLKDNWQTAYEAIYRANAVINRVGQLKTDDDVLKNRIIAEAKFLRALTYFNIVRFYGDVPLHLDELIDLDNLSNVNKPRASSSVVYDAIIEDLIFAENNLFMASWVSDLNKPSYEGGNLGRATVGAAKGLLAKVYLTRASYPERDVDSYQLAYNKAKEIITDGNYSLDSNYFNLNSLEGKTSHEWLFQIQYSVLGEQTSNWGGLQNPINQGSNGKTANDFGYGRMSPTLKFANSFEDGDLRFGSIAKGKINADGSIRYYSDSKKWYSHKYRFSSRPLSRFNTDMNAPVLRFADVLLIYAEAAAELGLDNDAYDVVDKILVRAQGGGTAPALVDRNLSNDELKEFILWERARELCFEGHSKFDIVRAGEDKFLEEVRGQLETKDETDPTKLKEVGWSKNVQSYHLLFPIPAAEMASNPSLSGDQNPGY